MKLQRFRKVQGPAQGLTAGGTQPSLLGFILSWVPSLVHKLCTTYCFDSKKVSFPVSPVTYQ